VFKTVFDTAPLITCCKFEVQGRLIIDYILDGGCDIVVPAVVQVEIMAERHRYPDAQLADQRIRSGRITVRDVAIPPDNIMALYGLGGGEQGAIALTVTLEPDIDYVVLDDKLAYIVCDRLGLPKLFLLDLVVNMVKQGSISGELGREICQAVTPRYSFGMVAHTLRILERGVRQWLW